MEEIQVREINEDRRYRSEYYHLFPTLKEQNKKFKNYMRMEVSTFEYILSNVKDSLTKNWCNLHTSPILPEEQLVITIRCLATGASYSDLSFSFSIAKSTVSKIVKEVCKALWSRLCAFHMPVPTTNNLIKIAQEYHSLWDIPHCIGAIDVRHIRIKKPSNSGRFFYNYKRFFSITLQAVVDALNRFIIIDVGGYGCQHDATTLIYSTFYKALKTGKLKIPKDHKLYSSDIILPYFFIGDGVYPLSKNLIKPYPGKGLSKCQKLFNARISRARVTVECAFGRLCQKFRIFYKPMEQQLESVELIVKAACMLHNIIIDREKPITIITNRFMQAASVLEADDQETGDLCNNETNEVLNGDGQTVRRKLIKFFLKNPINK